MQFLEFFVVSLHSLSTKEHDTTSSSSNSSSTHQIIICGSATSPNKGFGVCGLLQKNMYFFLLFSKFSSHSPPAAAGGPHQNHKPQTHQDMNE
jgi:hypothetical protein